MRGISERISQLHNGASGTSSAPSKAASAASDPQHPFSQQNRGGCVNHTESGQQGQVARRDVELSAHDADDCDELETRDRTHRQGVAEREREEAQVFAEARRQHPAVESAINNLEHRGLDRVRSHGADGFAHTVALSILAANLHRIGLLVRRRMRDAERRRRRRAA